MDQDKTDIPHIISKPKSMAGAMTLETHVTGVRAHGRCTVMAIDCGQFPHDSNLTIEILLRLFCELKVKHMKSHVKCVDFIFLLLMLTGCIAPCFVSPNGQYLP